MGRLGQRHRRARARLPRHLPGRLRPPGDNIPPRWRSPSSAAAWGRPGPGDRHRLRGPGRPDHRHRPAHKIDHVAHLGLSVAAGLGALLAARRGHLPGGQPGPARDHGHPPVAQGGHLQLEGVRPRPRRQAGRRGGRPGHARPGRPAPIWEGEDGVVAWLLDGPGACYRCRCPSRASPGGPSSTPTPRPTRPSTRPRPSSTWRVPAAGAGRRHRPGRAGRAPHQRPHPPRDRDRRRRPGEARPGGQPRDPRPLGHVHLRRRPPGRPLAPRRQLHPERAARPDTVRLWHRVVTVEDPAWTARYHDPDPARRAFGGRAEVHLAGGEVVAAELAVADAHPLGADPFTRPHYLRKLATLAEGVVEPDELERFAGLVERLGELGLGRAGRPHRGRRAPGRGGPRRPETAARRSRILDAVPGHRPARRPTSGPPCGPGWPRGGCCACPGRSRRWWPGWSRSSASTGRTCPGAVVAADLGLPDVGLTDDRGRPAGPPDRLRDPPAGAGRRRHRLRRA